MDCVTRPYRLRPEARPFTFGHLNTAQQKAFRGVVGLLVAAVRALENHEKDHLRSRTSVGLDPLRSARTVFLSAQRGAGKTSLWLSVMRAMQSEHGHHEKITGVPELDADLQSLHKRLLWLEPIDLEPLPRPSNLFAALLARLQSVFDRPVREHLQRKATGLLERADAIREPLSELTDLQRRAGMAWDGNLEARAAAIDPLTYASEVTRIEHDRVGLQRDFAELLDTLAETYTDLKPEKLKPLFVLPVDDFDLNPLRCLDLMRLLRFISAPRLFTVGLGDWSVASRLATVHLTHEILQSKRLPHLRGTMLEEHRGELAEMVSELAANALDKLVPPAQRIHIGYVDVTWALQYGPTSTDSGHALALSPRALFDVPGSNPWHEESLGRLLETVQIDLEHNSATRTTRWLSLVDLLLFPWTPAWNPETEPSLLGRPALDHDAWYTASELLASSPRFVANFYHGLASVARHSPGNRPADSDDDTLREAEQEFLAFLANQCRDAVRADPFLAPHSRAVNDDLFFQYGRNRWSLNTANLVCRPEYRAVERVRSGHLVTFGTSYHRAWNFEIAVAGRKIPVGAPAKYLLMLFHDLLMFSQNYTILGGDLTPRPTRHEWAYTEWHGRSRLRLGWPMPNWKTFWQYDMWLELWRNAQEWLDSSKEVTTPALIVDVWLGTLSAVDKMYQDLASSPRSWLAGLRKAAQPSAREWCVKGAAWGDAVSQLNAHLLLMPEYGLGEGVAKVTPTPDAVMCEAIKDTRARLLATLADVGLADPVANFMTASLVDGMTPDGEQVQLFMNGSSERRRLRALLKAASERRPRRRSVSRSRTSSR